jgi:hypothetical protein
MDIQHFMNGTVGLPHSGNVGIGEEQTSSTTTTMAWIVFGVVMGVAGTLVLQSPSAGGSAPKALATSKPVASYGFQPGWYVLLYDRVNDRKNYNGKGRLKEMEGPFMSQDDAQIGARKASESGWNKEANGRAVVKKLTKDPWKT